MTKDLKTIVCVDVRPILKIGYSYLKAPFKAET